MEDITNNLKAPSDESNLNNNVLSEDDQPNNITYEDALKDPVYYTKGIKATSNTLLDMINATKLDDVVILHIGKQVACIYHKCDGKFTDATKFFFTHRAIFLNVEDNPGLADKDDGWDFYICKDGVNNCTCEIDKHIRQQKSISYPYAYSLSFGMPVIIFNKEYIAKDAIISQQKKVEKLLEKQNSS